MNNNQQDIYYSALNPCKTIPHPDCKKTMDEYKEVMDKNGNKYLQKTGVINFYDKIQEAKEGVMLQELIDKYSIKINESDITKLDETIIDYTNMPDNLIDVLNTINDAKKVFEQSPRELKTRFNNNFYEFLQGAKNGALESIIKEQKKIQEKQNNKVLPGQISVEELKEQNEKLKSLLQEGGIKYE